MRHSRHHHTGGSDILPDVKIPKFKFSFCSHFEWFKIVLTTSKYIGKNKKNAIHFFDSQNIFKLFFKNKSIESKITLLLRSIFGKDMAKKGNRIQVIMECTEHKNSGVPGTSRYITTKNRKNTTQRMELKKYNPILKKVTVHKEIK